MKTVLSFFSDTELRCFYYEVRKTHNHNSASFTGLFIESCCEIDHEIKVQKETSLLDGIRTLAVAIILSELIKYVQLNTA